MSTTHPGQNPTSDIAAFVLLPGDPSRVEHIVEYWDRPKEIYRRREFVVFTGEYGGVRMTCASTGIGGPSTAIAMEELARQGARTFLRVGTCGSFQKHIKVGDLVVIDAAVRMDGTSATYAPLGFPASADYRLVTEVVRAAGNLGIPHHIGSSRTADTFYALHPEPFSSFRGYWWSEWRDHFRDMRAMGVSVAEMEAATVLVLARLWRLRAAAVAIVLDDLFEVAQDSARSGAFDPATQLASLDAEGIRRLAVVASDAMLALARQESDRV